MRGHLRLLLWLRLRTMLRARSWWARIGLGAIFLLVVLPLSLGGAWLVWGGTRWVASRSDPRLLGEWTHLLLCFFWLLFLLRPILGFGASEFYDITKLFVFPVSHRTVFIGQTLGMLFTGSSLFYLPAILALGLALPGSAALAAVRVAVLLLFVFHGVVLGQLLQLALLNVLRSRKFRDLAVVFGALVSVAFYLAFRFLGELADPRAVLDMLLDRHLSTWLLPVPSSWAAAALVPGAGTFAWILFLGGFLPFTALAVVLAGVLQERAFFGEMPTIRAKAETDGARPVRPARFPFTLVPGPARAVAGKELRTLRREPVIKSLLIQQFAFFLVPLALALLAPGFTSDRLRNVVGWAVYPMLVVESLLAMNWLGLEGGGLAHLLETSAPRDQVVLGKLLAYFCVWETLNLLVVGIGAVGAVALGAPFGPGDLLRIVMETTAALLVLLGIGAVASVAVPTPLTVRGRGALAQGQAGKEGCAVAIVRMLLLLLFMALLAPVALLAKLTGSLLLSLVGLAYAFAIFMAGYRMGSAMLADREELLLHRLARRRD